MPFRAEELRQRFAASIEQGRMGRFVPADGGPGRVAGKSGAGPGGPGPRRRAGGASRFSFCCDRNRSRGISRSSSARTGAGALPAALHGAAEGGDCFDAERMCLGRASAANAFLKTLEEPPAHTLILLTLGRPAMLLPTIISRCLRLDLGFEDIDSGAAQEPEWIKGVARGPAEPGIEGLCPRADDA